MPELIDRNHAEQAIEAYLCSRCERNDNEVCHNCPHIGGDEILKSVPTIEAEPIKHGRWIPHRITSSSMCSECKKYAAFETPRCPYCGAYLQGGAENG